MSVKQDTLALAVPVVGAGVQGWTRLGRKEEATSTPLTVQLFSTGWLRTSTNGVFHTTLATGVAWNSITTSLLNVDSVELAAAGTPEVLPVTTPYRLWRSTNENVISMHVHPGSADQGNRLRHLSYSAIANTRRQTARQSQDAEALWELIPLHQVAPYGPCLFGALNTRLFRVTNSGSSRQSVTNPPLNEPITDVATTGGLEHSICVVLASGPYRSLDRTASTATSTPRTIPRGIPTAPAGAAVTSREVFLVPRANNTLNSGYADHTTAPLPVSHSRSVAGSGIRRTELYRWNLRAPWQIVRADLNSPQIPKVAQFSSGFAARESASLLRSDTDATRLSNIALSLPQSHPLTAAGMYCFGIAVAASLGIHRYDNNSTGTWRVLTEDLPTAGFLVLTPESPLGERILALSDPEEPPCSTDRGRGWKLSALNLRVALVIASGASFLTFGADGIAQSTDSGSTGQPIGRYPGEVPCSLISYPAAPQMLLAASSLPGTRKGRLYCSTDSHQSWQTIGTADPLLGGLTALSVGASMATWYAGTLEGEILRSIDGGLLPRLPSTPGDGLLVHALLERPMKLLAVTPQGLWHSGSISAKLSPAASTMLQHAAVTPTVSPPIESAVELCLFTPNGELMGHREHHSTARLQLALPPVAAGTYLAILRFSGSFRSQLLLVP